MPSKLPNELQELIDEIPAGYSLRKYLFTDGRRVKVDTQSRYEGGQGRRYSYWLTNTGDEVDVDFHEVVSPKEGILTGTCDAWGSKPRILGRDPDVARSHFKVWYGVHSGFGASSDPNVQLVIKSAEEPTWVRLVRRGESYNDLVGDHPPRRSRRPVQDQEANDAAFSEHETEAYHGSAASQKRRRSERRTVVNLHGSEYIDRYETSSDEDDQPIQQSRKCPVHQQNQAFDSVPFPSLRVLEQQQTVAREQQSFSTSNVGPVSKLEQGTPGRKNMVSKVQPIPNTGTESDNAIVVSGHLNDIGRIRVEFKAFQKSTYAERTRPWRDCDSSEKLFTQARVSGVLERNKTFHALSVKVWAGDQEVEVVNLAQDDAADFSQLQSWVEEAQEAVGASQVLLEVQKL